MEFQWFYRKKVSWLLYYQLDTARENVSIGLACVLVGGTLSYLLINVGGPSPLWVACCTREQAEQTMENKAVNSATPCTSVPASRFLP